MKTEIVITDLTRMLRGMVCIAGYDAEHRCIRPTLPPPGIPEGSLFNRSQPIIYPFAVVEFDLLQPTPEPPHTEDQLYDPRSPRFIRNAPNRQAILEWSQFDNVSAIFGQPVHTDFGYYVMDCQGERSLGTIKPQTIKKVIYEQDIQGAWDYRFHFFDGVGEFFRLKITDLTWQYYCQSQRRQQSSSSHIAEQLTHILKRSQVYLRIGLARGWKKFPERCYLQITGVYTFPDYLDGKIFAEFITQEGKS